MVATLASDFHCNCATIVSFVVARLKKKVVELQKKK